MRRSEQVNILHIDDDEMDRYIFKKAFSKIGVEARIVDASDGEEGLDLLREIQESVDHFLIVLDISMPRMDGLEFLKEVQSDKNLHKHPVFVFTSSARSSDVGTAYDLGASIYTLKGDANPDYSDFASLISKIWKLIELP